MIKILEKHVADRIAAGEVVDRPLSVVKELLENSIDAGANTIVIEIKNGGKSYIRITDDGCGIPKDEVILAFARHATSKIVTDEDLDSISTLGFRGEALASISSVSRIELLTKTNDEKLGTKVTMHGGDLIENLPFGCPEGTTIIVSDLFYNTPARLKFMKADNAESSLIIDFVSQMAIAYPHIRMRLINNGNILFSTNGSGNLYNTIMTIYSKSIGEDLIPVDFSDSYAHLRGFVSSPKTSKTSRKNQIFFVNGRRISSKIIEKGINTAYSDRLFEGRHPVAFFFLNVESDKVDVNIHPNKKEVRFHDENFISDFIAEAIKQTLSTKSAIPEIKAENIFKLRTDTKSSYKNQRGVQVDNLRELEYINRPDNNEITEKNGKIEKSSEVDIKSILSDLRNLSNQDEVRSEYWNDCPKNYKIDNSSENESCIGLKEGSERYVESSNKEYDFLALHKDTKLASQFKFESLRPLGSIFATYIVATDEDSFYLIDQHAAHERIFFEKLLFEFKSSEKHSQPLLLPLTFDLSAAITNREEEWLTKLLSMGYEIENFGTNTYIIKAVPIFMSMAEAEDFLNMFIDNIDENVDFSDLGQLERIISKSCKSAVKANDILHEEEIAELLFELSKCQNPYSCPHGRPTFIRMKKYEIEKMFKRV